MEANYKYYQTTPNEMFKFIFYIHNVYILYMSMFMRDNSVDII